MEEKIKGHGSDKESDLHDSNTAFIVKGMKVKLL